MTGEGRVVDMCESKDICAECAYSPQNLEKTDILVRAGGDGRCEGSEGLRCNRDDWDPVVTGRRWWIILQEVQDLRVRLHSDEDGFSGCDTTTMSESAL